MGIFKNCETPRGTKRLCSTKTKFTIDILPALSEQLDAYISNNVSPFTYFVMAKNLRNDCINMIKDKVGTKKEVDDKYK